MDVTAYEHSDHPVYNYYNDVARSSLFRKAIGNITKFRVENRYDIRTFPSKRIKVFDYDTCRLTEVKVNASFDELGDTLYFKLPYAE